MNKQKWYNHVTEYYSVIKRTDILLCIAAWISCENTAEWKKSVKCPQLLTWHSHKRRNYSHGRQVSRCVGLERRVLGTNREWRLTFRGFSFGIRNILIQTVVIHAQHSKWASRVPSTRGLRHWSASVGEHAQSHWSACCEGKEFYGIWIRVPGSCCLLRLSKGQSRLLRNREIP